MIAFYGKNLKTITKTRNDESTK